MPLQGASHARSRWGGARNHLVPGAHLHMLFSSLRPLKSLFQRPHGATSLKVMRLGNKWGFTVEVGDRVRCPFAPCFLVWDLLPAPWGSSPASGLHIPHHCTLLVFSTAPASPALLKPSICLFLLIKCPVKRGGLANPWNLAYEEQSTLFQD